MKKLLIVFSFALALTSCVREQFPFSGREIAISVGMGRAATKAADTPEETLLTTIPVQMEDGTEILLEAWLSDTACAESVDTKGTQLNDVSALASAYGKFLTTVYEGNVVYNYDFGGKTEMKDVEVSYSGDSETAWKFGNQTYYWPDEHNRPLTFISYAPAENSGIENFRLSDGKVLFDYSTPVSNGSAAEAQLDLLVGLDPNQSRTNNHGNAEVHFVHALTSVKFVCKNWNGVQVDSIRLENFYSKGSATLSEGGAFSWTVSGDPVNFTQSFGTTPSESIKDDNGNYVLDDSGVRTFMVIPQKLHRDAKITVFLDRTHGEVSIDIAKLSALLDNQVPTPNRLDDWSKYAGKTITFKINNDKIDDYFIVNASEDGTAFSISFTGATPNYVRAAVVINIEDEKGNVLTSWIGSDFDKEYLNFEYNTDWDKNEEADGFYYYKDPVSVQNGAVEFLSGFTFNSNNLPINPNPDEILKGIPDHLSASILVQGSTKHFSEWK